MRQGFKFYRSYYDVFNELPDKDKLKFIKALLDRQFTGVEPVLKGMAQFAYISQKHSIDSQVKGYEDKSGKKLTPLQGGGIGVQQGAKQPPSLEEKEKEQEKVKVKEKGVIVYPWDTEKFKEQWQFWKDYKKDEFSFKYKTIQSEQAALKNLAGLAKNNENIAIEIIHQSFANGWKGFFELKNNKNERFTETQELRSQRERLQAEIDRERN